MNFDLIKIDSLQKVFPGTRPDIGQSACLSGLWGETLSFQVAYKYGELRTRYVKISAQSPLVADIRIREVGLVPNHYPCHPNADDGYISKAPGLYPDLLRALPENRMKLIRGQWRSVWVDVPLVKGMVAGTYPVTVTFEFEKTEGEEAIEPYSVTEQIEVIPAALPPLSIPHTEWFHGDCLADYYGVDVFSEKHWALLESFIQEAANNDCNMLLTPIFTPPLDTAKGGERTTIQLVGVEVTEGGYRFDFSLLRRWVELAKKAGFTFFEMSHLFTQWGAFAAPKIMGTVDGELKQIFGWETPATGEAYIGFLGSFLPELITELKVLGVDQHTYFHISDEPSAEQLDTYRAAVEAVRPYLTEFPIIDALSSYEFYQHGLVEQPVCATNHIEPFLENEVPNLWSYYCTAQGVDVSNRFLALPSFRNRIYGVQIYKYDIAGILHWGYNFYNSEHSVETINPYEVTDCREAFPGGDPFLVYPGADGQPEASIRLMVHSQALADYRAFKLLESYIGKEAVMAILEKPGDSPITFKAFPQNPAYLFDRRAEVNERIKEMIKNS